jgi:hypothetical protein
MNILNTQTHVSVLEMSGGADVVGATKIFESEIGGEEIICGIQSFVMIDAQHFMK